jgi:hypothetical protein
MVAMRRRQGKLVTQAGRKNSLGRQQNRGLHSQIHNSQLIFRAPSPQTCMGNVNIYLNIYKYVYRYR